MYVLVHLFSQQSGTVFRKLKQRKWRRQSKESSRFTFNRYIWFLSAISVVFGFIISKVVSLPPLFMAFQRRTANVDTHEKKKKKRKKKKFQARIHGKEIILYSKARRTLRRSGKKLRFFNNLTSSVSSVYVRTYIVRVVPLNKRTSERASDNHADFLGTISFFFLLPSLCLSVCLSVRLCFHAIIKSPTDRQTAEAAAAASYSSG